MELVMSKRRLSATVLGLTLFGALAVGGLHANPAAADKGHHNFSLDTVDYGEDDGDWVEFWKDDQDQTWVFVVEHYKYTTIITPYDDPAPDDSEERGDLTSTIALLKQRGGALVMGPAFSDSPLGKRLTQAGKGLIPVYNPSDVGFQDDGGVGSGGGGFDPGGGSIEEQLKKHAKHGNGNGGKGDDGGDLKPSDAGLFDDDMPGPPPLVNPNPVLGTTRCCTHATGGSNGGGAGGGGSSGGGHSGARG
jgi:hypothetical protein